jgi:hypothetical protein
MVDLGEKTFCQNLASEASKYLDASCPHPQVMIGLAESTSPALRRSVSPSRAGTIRPVFVTSFWAIPGCPKVVLYGLDGFSKDPTAFSGA